ncbi:hypothetical protein [Ruegeria sp.]|uniref:hypothetical protein n=1 Tax=Ruegeria sp. TaxID=1879320 RepID=UPI0023196C9B|nr:hypothetical protein [Ruegeria sp.]MDA7964455.1 hypothetical protein [Ruegeria sp.]
MRSLSATARRMEKDAERRRKQVAKAQIAANAAEDVENWENYIEELLTVHTDLTDRIDWEALLAKPQPKEPALETYHEDKARAALSTFKPGWFDFFQGGTARKRQRLSDALAQAAARDTSDYQRATEVYVSELADWKTDRELAQRLANGEAAAIQEVITEMQSLSGNDLIGSSVQFSINDNYVHARPQVHASDIVPNYRRKQLASGKLSETKMPVGQFNELYQDYVASVALKIAGDLFQILPLNEVYVTCESVMLNSATGHKEPTPVLSVQFVRETMMQLNLSNLDPSDAMSNFNHVMKFTKTKGFASVKPLRDEGRQSGHIEK